MLDYLKSLPGKFRQNIFLKLFSLVLAFLLWVLVVAYYNPQTTNMITGVPITIKYNGMEISDPILKDAELILVDPPEVTVDVKIEGRREIMARVNKDKVSATVDISTVFKAGTYEPEIKIEVDGEAVTTLYQSMDTVTLKFEKLVTETIEVDPVVKGNVAEGCVLEKSASPASVMVTGPVSVVSKIKTVQAVVTQEEFTDSVNSAGVVEYLDENGEKIEDTYLSLNVDQIMVDVSVLQLKTVPLTIELTNSSGGNDALYLTKKIQPESITIKGTVETLSKITSISLGPLDVSELSGNYKKTHKISVDEKDVEIVDSPETATVSIAFDDFATKSYVMSSDLVRVENVPAEESVTVVKGNINILVRGNPADLDKLKKSDISLRLDCKNQELPKGANRMKLRCVFPEGIKVGVAGKYEVTVQVE